MFKTPPNWALPEFTQHDDIPDPSNGGKLKPCYAWVKREGELQIGGKPVSGTKFESWALMLYFAVDCSEEKRPNNPGDYTPIQYAPDVPKRPLDDPGMIAKYPGGTYQYQQELCFGIRYEVEQDVKGNWVSVRKYWHPCYGTIFIYDQNGNLVEVIPYLRPADGGDGMPTFYPGSQPGPRPKNNR
jgi:hypothetical protein